jgi:hypothetical protein
MIDSLVEKFEQIRFDSHQQIDRMQMIVPALAEEIRDEKR